MWNYRPEPDTSGHLHTEGRQTSAGSAPPCAAQARSQNAKGSLTGKQTHNSPLSSLQERGRGEGFRPVRQRLTHSASTSIAGVLGLGCGAVTSRRVPGCSLTVSKYVEAACSPVTWNMGPSTRKSGSADTNTADTTGFWTPVLVPALAPGRTSRSGPPYASAALQPLRILHGRLHSRSILRARPIGRGPGWANLVLNQSAQSLT